MNFSNIVTALVVFILSYTLKQSTCEVLPTLCESTCNGYMMTQHIKRDSETVSHLNDCKH